MFKRFRLTACVLTALAVLFSVPANAGDVPGSQPQQATLQVGSGGAVYYTPICDTYAAVAASTATTKLLVTGITNESIYVCTLVWESTGTNSANTINFEWGQGLTCAVNTQALFPAAIAPGTATGEWLTGWGTALVAITTVAGMPAPASAPLIVPNSNPGYNLCGVSAGTTTAGTYVVWYTIH